MIGLEMEVCELRGKRRMEIIHVTPCQEIHVHIYIMMYISHRDEHIASL